MASKIKVLREKAVERGDLVGHLLPAKWIELEGKFSVEELETILSALKNNIIKLNGNT